MLSTIWTANSINFVYVLTGGVPLLEESFSVRGTLLPMLLASGGQLVLQGSGDAELERAFQAAARANPAQIGVRIGYDEAFAHRLIAGADVIMVPSRFEPCGLTQLYSLAYGTVPIVRRTGGLADSVVGLTDENLEHATGFQFDEASPHALGAAVLYAQRVFFHKETWGKLVQNGMSADFSWNRSAEVYEAVYRRAREVRGLPW